jgi:glucose/arabinose dehydrogenase
MQHLSNPLMYEPGPGRRGRAKHVIIAVILLSAAAAWIVQTARRGKFTADPSGVTLVTSTTPANGEADVLPNAFICAYLNPGHALDRATLDSQSVRLYRADNLMPVAAQVSTSAACDDIVLTPLQILEPRTKYTFEVNGVKDSTGADLLAFSMSFTTSGGNATSQYPVAFEKLDLPSAAEFYTCLTVGPDHQLYAATMDGKILRRAIREDGSLGEAQVIKSVQEANDGPRVITGICFDPKSTREDLVLWVSHGQFLLNQHGQPSFEGYSDWTGKISTLSGPDLRAYRDLVVGLPRSWRDHLNNQPAFGPDGCLYWSQGSHTAMGAPDPKWGGNRVERLLSAAVLRLNTSKVDSTLDAKTVDGGGSYDPFADDAPLTIYASGVRVGYDMLWHSNGWLYTAINGSAMGGNTPGTPPDYDGPVIAAIKDVDETQPDLLLKLEKGRYYGHPNPLRGQYVLNGGNPTAAADPLEVSKYPVGTMPDHNWRRPIYNFGTSASPNGTIEYQSHGRLFGGALDGKVLITRLNANDIIVLSLDGNGDVAESITGIAGLTSFTQPLDLAEDQQSGCIYVAEYRGQKLALLRPITDAAKLAQLRQNIFRQQIRASVGE